MDAHVVAIGLLGQVLGHRGVETEAEPLLERAPEALGGRAVVEEEELEPRLLAVLAQDVAVAEDLRDPLDHRQHLVRPDERVEPRGQVRPGGEAAAHPEREADPARVGVAHRGERHVVDLGVRAPDAAAGDRDLVLAGQVVELGAAVHHRGGRLDQRRGVEHLVGVEPGERAAGDVAGDVAAGAEGRQPARGQRGEDRGQVLHPDPVELDVLAHREVGHPARVSLGEGRDGLELGRDEEAVGDADAQHEAGHRAALAALAADRAHPVALSVDAPPAEVGAEPLRRDGLHSFPGEPLDLGIGGPRVQRPLEPLRPLRFRLLHRLAHGVSLLVKMRKPRRAACSRGPRSAFCLSASTRALARSASSDVPEGNADPRFTAWTLRGDLAGGPVDLQDGVLDDHVRLPRDHDLARADATANRGGDDGLSGQNLVHGWNSTIPTGVVKNSRPWRANGLN